MIRDVPQMQLRLRRRHVSRGAVESAAAIGRELAESIVEGRDDQRLTWQDDRTAVKVDSTSALYAYPGMGAHDYDAVRRAFLGALEEVTGPHGWTRSDVPGLYRQTWQFRH